MRRSTFLLCGFDTVAWLFTAAATFWSAADPATRGFDRAAGAIVTLLFAITTVPALALAFAGRAPRVALRLAAAFPAMFAVLFLAAVIIFA